MSGTPNKPRFVWVDEKARIASFHPVKGYVKRLIPDQDAFVQLLNDLLEEEYRIQ